MAIIALYPGYPDNIGRRFAFAGVYTGPASYVTGGDPVQLPGYKNYIDAIHGTLTLSGTYVVRAFPSGAGPRQTWSFKWYAASSPQTEVTAATNLSAEKLIVDGLGGVY